MSDPPSPGSLTLDEARALWTARDWRTLAARGASLPDGALLAEPELAFRFADASLRLGDAPRALAVAQAVEPEVARGGDRRLRLEIVNHLGVALFESGRADDAGARWEELLELADAWDDEEFAARACNNLGVVANVRGRRDLALTYYERALASYQRLGYTRGLAQTQHNLGISYRDLGFADEADAHFLRAIEMAEAAGSEDVVALAETERAMLRARAGDGALAATMGRRARERFRRIGDPTGEAQAIRVLAAAARGTGEEDSAGALLDEALGIARAHADALLHAEVERDRGELFRDRGDGASAVASFREAAERFRGIGAVAESDEVERMASELGSG